MTDATFKPTIYLKAGCPFCLKVRLFLLEAGQLDQACLREFVPGDDEETTIRELLAPAVETVTFPTAELTPGRFTTESDAIVAHFANLAGVDPDVLPTYRSYLDGVYKGMQSLFRENLQLKKQAESA
ncbi:glutathione S-transferase N-terminal domain-containing protein [Methylobacterium sp. J-078]|uniref:glutathione S-transferase N-terminal domain-containing protein n=1 Tax=Methylobacterium sp. J-078 TaxID=2836657 RepID=UPI001FBA4335|nr:glutathione S-transferase N-terminal domain-containing protein [Methylobacterium sp. J-078]MCJ2046410.1 glutathione S-transferase N-terminal domain-containing protein [Methylobacterium sp. J-078]